MHRTVYQFKASLGFSGLCMSVWLLCTEDSSFHEQSRREKGGEGRWGREREHWSRQALQLEIIPVVIHAPLSLVTSSFDLDAGCGSVKQARASTMNLRMRLNASFV